MGPIVIYENRVKLAALFFGAFLLDTACVLLLARHPASMSAKTTGAAIVGIPFFGACGLFALCRLLWRKPAISIDNDGLTDHASGLSVGFIPWSDMTDARIFIRSFGSSRQKFLGVALRNPNDYLAKCGPLTRILLRANKGLNGYIVNIPQTALSVQLDVVVAHIQFYLRRGEDRPYGNTHGAE